MAELVTAIQIIVAIALAKWVIRYLLLISAVAEPQR
jgi:hypothetical protein